MDVTKYADMAYLNSSGRKWLKALTRDDIWKLWDKKLKGHAFYRGPLPEDYRWRVLIEAIWHLGYACDWKNKSEMVRCAHRLRREGDRALKLWNLPLGPTDLRLSSLPWELCALDDFLERHVRPLL